MSSILFSSICPHLNQCPSKTDEELVVMVKQKKECYVCLMQRYEDKIARYIIRISGVNQETAEDILQNVFLKAFVNLNDFDSTMKFSSWLYRIAHNETINHWRRNKNSAATKISWDENDALKNIIKDTYNVEDAVYQKLINKTLLEVIDALDDKYRAVVILNYIEGKSYQEISDILKKPIGTIGTLISRAKKMLAKKLEEKGIVAEAATRQE